MKTKTIEFAIRTTDSIRKITRYVDGVGHYADYDYAKKVFAEKFAASVAKRILHDFDKLVEYRSEKTEGLFYQEARITIMGDDVKYDN